MSNTDKNKRGKKDFSANTQSLFKSSQPEPTKNKSEEPLKPDLPASDMPETATQPAPAKRPQGRPRIHPEMPAGARAKQSLPEGFTRATYIVREDYNEKIRDLAVWTGTDIKTIMDKALELYLTSFEEDHGKIPARPAANPSMIDIKRNR